MDFHFKCLLCLSYPSSNLCGSGPCKGCRTRQQCIYKWEGFGRREHLGSSGNKHLVVMWRTDDGGSVCVFIIIIRELNNSITLKTFAFTVVRDRLHHSGGYPRHQRHLLSFCLPLPRQVTTRHPLAVDLRRAREPEPHQSPAPPLQLTNSPYSHPMLAPMSCSRSRTP
jgi:hypothetical protein